MAAEVDARVLLLVALLGGGAGSAGSDVALEKWRTAESERRAEEYEKRVDRWEADENKRLEAQERMIRAFAQHICRKDCDSVNKTPECKVLCEVALQRWGGL